MDAMRQVRDLLDLIEWLLPAERRTPRGTLLPGDLVQISSTDNFDRCLFRITRYDARTGLFHGVHLIDHRAGALEGSVGYRVDQLQVCGHLPERCLIHQFPERDAFGNLVRDARSSAVLADVAKLFEKKKAATAKRRKTGAAA